MNDFRHKLTCLLAAALALTVIPFAAFATGEDTLEPAPAVELSEDAAAETPEEAEPPVWTVGDDSLTQSAFWEDPYHPSLVYVNRDEDVQGEEWIYGQDGLTNEECGRIARLQEEVAAGTRSLEDVSYPDYQDDMRIAVFAVDPADFAGETYYVTLPDRKLKDYELLYLMSCFDKLGIPFDPEALYSRNCRRGYVDGGVNRKLSADEQQRMDIFLGRVIRGQLTAEDVHPETECQSMQTCFGPFTLYPYRPMTDDELAAFALVRDIAWEDDPDEVEKTAREFASGIFKVPLSMKLAQAERSLIPYTDTAEGYCLTFRVSYADGNGKTVYPTDKPNQVYVYLRKRMDNGRLVGESARVEYYPDINLLFSRTIGAELSRETMTAIGTKWIKDHCLLTGLDTDFRFYYDANEDYGFRRVWADSIDWALFAEMDPDGYIQYLSAQRLFY